MIITTTTNERHGTKMKEYIITGYDEGNEFTPILIYAKDYTEAYLNACYKLPQGATINKVIEVNG